MGDMGELFRDWNEVRREQRSNNLENAFAAGTNGWTVHVPFHWSRDLFGERIDYWPSKKKFRWRGRTRTGDVEAFIRNLERKLHSAYANGTDGWIVHTPFHWSRMVLGDSLDYWPSDRMFQWRGRTYWRMQRADVENFIRNRETEQVS